MVECGVNGSQAVGWDGWIYQVLSIPSPPGMLVVIPKYEPCKGPSPWRRPGSNYCRVTSSYGPLGVELGISRWGRARFDPVYSTLMPYLEESEVRECIDPRRGLEEAIARGDYDVVRLLEALEAEGIRVSQLGLTGSHALGIAHGESDVDLVIYEGHDIVYRLFAARSTGPVDANLGGVRVSDADFSWRKGVIAGVRATWVPAGHRCPPLRHYHLIPQPTGKARLALTVPPGQDPALGYPPCALSEEGVWIVSFEFNLAGILYSGGRLEVDGLISVDGRIVYVGVREYPGSLLASGGEVD